MSTGAPCVDPRNSSTPPSPDSGKATAAPVSGRRKRPLGPLGNHDLPVVGPQESRRVQTAILAPPPGAGPFPGGPVGKPVLPHHRSYLLRRGRRKRIETEKGQHIFVAEQQLLLGAHHKRIFPPPSERSEPQIPLEARLVGSVDSRGLVDRLRLVAKRIGRPALPVVRTLKFNLITRPGHAPEQAVGVGDA